MYFIVNTRLLKFIPGRRVSFYYQIFTIGDKNEFSGG